MRKAIQAVLIIGLGSAAAVALHNFARAQGFEPVCHSYAYCGGQGVCIATAEEEYCTGEHIGGGGGFGGCQDGCAL